jgi:hypothetical protein
MIHLPLGSWISARSEISGYTPGQEWLHFTSTGPHVWELQNPAKPWICHFVIMSGPDGYLMIPISNATESAKKYGWKISIKATSPEQIVVIGPHGHATTFSKCRADSPKTFPEK